MSRSGIEQSTNYFLKTVWLGNIVCLEIRHQLWTKDKRFSSCLNVHVIPLFLDSELMVRLCSRLRRCKYDVAYLKVLALKRGSWLDYRQLGQKSQGLSVYRKFRNFIFQDHLVLGAIGSSGLRAWLDFSASSGSWSSATVWELQLSGFSF